LLRIREAANAAARYVHAHGGDRDERLLDIPNHVQDMVELGILHKVAVALTVAHVCLGHVLHHLVGLLEG
jgi:hypothetical protein